MAQLNASEQEKLHEHTIVKDTNNVLAFDFHYCAAHEIATEYGNSAWCFPWCEIDAVVYPKMGSQLGFRFRRTGTLIRGSAKCDFRYERI